MGTLTLDMQEVYAAENRLEEVKIVTPSTAPELVGYFNLACNTATKYLSWVEYEILMARKHYELATATVILEKAPQEFAKIKDTGMKFNEDFRKALITKDSDCQKCLDALNMLEAVKVLLTNKAKSFERAYFACKMTWERKHSSATNPNFSTVLGSKDDMSVEHSEIKQYDILKNLYGKKPE